MFSPTIINSNLFNFHLHPYTSYQEVGSQETTIDMKPCTKKVFKKDHGVLWRIGNCALGILACLAIVPLIVDLKSVCKIFRRVRTGEEIKILLILKDRVENKSTQGENSTQSKDSKFETTIQLEGSTQMGNPVQSEDSNPSGFPSESKDSVPTQTVETLPPSGSTEAESPTQKLLDINFKKVNLAYRDFDTVQQRRIPICGGQDHIDFSTGKSRGPEQLYFQDDQIISKKSIVKKDLLQIKDFPSNPQVYKWIQIIFTDNLKPIIIQQGSLASLGAAAAMLILDHRSEFNTSILETRGREFSELSRFIKRAGLTPIQHEFTTLNKLKKDILDNGSAALLINQFHVIVVDHISENLKEVRLRDPYHGWEITVDAFAFFSIKPGPYVQIFSLI